MYVHDPHVFTVQQLIYRTATDLQNHGNWVVNKYYSVLSADSNPST